MPFGENISYFLFFFCIKSKNCPPPVNSSYDGILVCSNCLWRIKFGVLSWSCKKVAQFVLAVFDINNQTLHARNLTGFISDIKPKFYGFYDQKDLCIQCNWLGAILIIMFWYCYSLFRDFFEDLEIVSEYVFQFLTFIFIMLCPSENSFFYKSTEMLSGLNTICV